MNDLNEFLSLMASAKKVDPVAKKAHEIKEHAKQDLGQLFAQLAEAKKQDPKQQLIDQVKENVKEDLTSLFEQLGKVDSPVAITEEAEQHIDTLMEVVQVIEEESLIEVAPISEPVTQQERQNSVEKYAAALPKETHSYQQPIEQPVAPEIKTITEKLKFLEQWVGKISAAGPGSGEVNFRYLDDVNRGTMTADNNNWVLEYDAASKKVQFTKDIGPIDSVQFDVTHVDDTTHAPGTLCWNAQDMTLNLHHPQGSRQQIGMEQYYPPVLNQTGSDIADGTVVMFAGAEDTNDARLLIGPMVADGTFPSLYTMGVVTGAIADGETGFVTTFGYVNDIDTSMWNKGDILYADPAVPGGMTNVKPTSPNNCVVIAAVVRKDATTGRIMVRPTIEQRMLYGRFASTVTQTPSTINTPYALDFNISEVERGFHRDGGGLPSSAITAEESGYYSASAILSLTSTNSSAKAFYVWLRKNGVDVPLSARRQSVSGNGTYQSFIYRTTLSLNKGDYFQIMYAASDTTILIESPAATSFCPAVPAATLLVTQVAL